MSRFSYGNPDANQEAIIKVYRQCGWNVAITSKVGNGFPDLVVANHGDDTLVEVKIKKGKLRDSQIKFIRTWRGKPVAIIRSVEDALRHIQTGQYNTLAEI